MEFIYKAKDLKGAEKIGKIEARSEDLAVQLLQGYGLIVYDLKAVENQGIFDKLFGKKKHIGTKELSLFLRQFSTLLSSKVPLMDSLKTLILKISSIISLCSCESKVIKQSKFFSMALLTDSILVTI